MKTSGGQHTNQSKQALTQTPKPEIRDNPDSRKNEEQEFRGFDRIKKFLSPLKTHV